MVTGFVPIYKIWGVKMKI